VGRLDTAPSVFNGPNSACRSVKDTWNRCSAWGMSFSWCRPRSRNVACAGNRPVTRLAVTSEMTIWPPCAVAAIRAARCTSIPT
jgi:hypothetical protein